MTEVGAERGTACLRIAEIRPEMARARAVAARPASIAQTSDSSPVVRVLGLEKVYGRGGRQTRALDGVDLEVCDGESVGLVGASGSGKTTLARCLVGLAAPSAGRIEIAGMDASDYRRLSDRELRRLRRTIQYVFQDPYSSLNPSRTVGATLREALNAHRPRGTARARDVTALLTRVGLPVDFARRKPAALSGGERQRVAIARALAVQPRVIVCDEPVSALDVSVQAQILDVLRELRDELGVSYLFITHDLAVVRQVADRLYVLYRGQVVEHGLTETLLEEPGHAYTRRLLEAVPTTPDRRDALDHAE